MNRNPGGRSPRLVTRFALSSLVAFVAIGLALAWVVSDQLRAREEQAAKNHALFVTDSILRYVFTPHDLRHPMDTKGARYRKLVDTVETRVLVRPVVVLKVWAPDGTILFSSDPLLVGRKFPDEAAELRDALAGTPSSGVTDLTDDENVDERIHYDKLYSTYAPLRLGKDIVPVAVAELYTDYAQIQNQVDSLFKTLVLTLLLGLTALYVFLLPIARRVARTMSNQNRQLEHQATRLRDLLGTEQQRVAQLQQLNRMKDDFVAVASHELRTPLTSIIGYAKTLRRPEFSHDDAVRDEFLHAIERQGDRLSRLVKNLLNTAQLEDERSHLTITSVLFDELVREIMVSLGPQQAGRLRLEIQKDLPPLFTDRARVELILSNLIDNALKFSPTEQECRLGARREFDYLVFWVQDRGVGIPADQLDHIFDRFYQVDSSTTRQYGGVGLGLSLVKELVRSLEGTIDVQSEVDQGSTFTVRIPLRMASPSTAPNDFVPYPGAASFAGQRRR